MKTKKQKAAVNSKRTFVFGVITAATTLLTSGVAVAEPTELHVNAEDTKFRPGKGLQFKSLDGAFTMIPRLRVQFRYLLNDEEGDFQHGMIIRRARLQFAGNFFGKHNRYKAEFAFSPRDESVKDDGPTITPLLDWYVQFGYFRDLNLRMGQYKVPFNRQRVISSGDLQLVDRALAQGQFNVDRDMGFDFRSKDLFGLGMFKYYAGLWFNQGRDARNLTDFHHMYIARIEFLPFGHFNDYKEADLDRTDTPKLSIGVAYSYIDDARNDRGIKGKAPADGGTTDFHIGNVDLMFKYLGLSIFGELFLRDGERAFGNAVDEDGMAIPRVGPKDGWGWFLQGGYVLPSLDVEFGARYSEVRPAGNDNTTVSHRREVGVGAGYYFGGHPFKLQADLFRQYSQEFDDGWTAFRVQLQAAY